LEDPEKVKHQLDWHGKHGNPALVIRQKIG
jgi:hypothetical protein